jgi:uncharacterized protein (TIGR03118 family)
MINLVSRWVGPATVIAIAVIAVPTVRADDNRYIVTKLVSDLTSLGGGVVDPVLQNAWGVVFTPGASPFWVSDNASGCSTLYDGQGVPQALKVRIPLPGGVLPKTACQHFTPPPPNAVNPPPTPAAPTGVVWNPTSTFLVPNTGKTATFIFDTEDGTISAWTGGLNPADAAVLAVDNSATPTPDTGAVYKGLVFGTNSNGVFLFAANFRAGTIDVFGPAPVPPPPNNGFYVQVTTKGGFKDPDIPNGFAPFGIQNINGDLFVTYALQNSVKHDDVAAPGNGFVDVFNTDGVLLRRFASRGQLNSPWGVARASYAFGRFSSDILVGNFGDGKINAFDSNGNFLGSLRDQFGLPIRIDGLWTLIFGGGKNSSPDTLYFTAGPNGEIDGLFGKITPVSDNDDH